MGVIPISVCVGCGLTVSGTGLLEVLLRPGGGISCDNSGADAGLFVTTATTGSNCIDVASGVVSINLSEDACNGLQCRGNGLYAPCPDSIVDRAGSGSTTATPVGVNGTATPPNNYIFESTDTITICNTTCCTVSGRLTVSAGGIYALPAGPGLIIEGFLETSTNAGPYIGASPLGSRLVHNNHGTNDLFADFNNLHDNVVTTLAPTECVTVRSRVRYTVTSGALTSGTLGGASQQFEYQWDLNQTGCC